MTQEVVGMAILTPLNILLWLRVGFSTGKDRTRAWAAICVLYVMWTIQLATVGNMVAIAAAVNTVVFCVITMYRYRHDYPESRYALWYNKLPWRSPDEIHYESDE